MFKRCEWGIIKQKTAHALLHFVLYVLSGLYLYLLFLPFLPIVPEASVQLSNFMQQVKLTIN